MKTVKAEHFCFKAYYPSFQRMVLRTIAGNKEQPLWVPKFTNKGFEKTRIPPDVYAMLLWEYERLKNSMQEEPNLGGLIHSEEIIKDEKNKKSRIEVSKNIFLTVLRWSFMISVFNTSEEWA